MVAVAAGMMHLRGRIALVTGGSRGLGPHIARALARAGMEVVLVARDAAGLEQAAASVRALGMRAATVPADLTSGAERERVAGAAAAALGPIDVLVNNAAVEPVGGGGSTPSMLLPGMVARRRGHVVYLASLAGKKGAPYDAAYSGTKAALVEWSSALRPELHGTGVGSSVVRPGYVTGEGMFGMVRHGAARIPGIVQAGAGGAGGGPRHSAGQSRAHRELAPRPAAAPAIPIWSRR